MPLSKSTKINGAGLSANAVAALIVWMGDEVWGLEIPLMAALGIVVLAGPSAGTIVSWLVKELDLEPPKEPEE